MYCISLRENVFSVFIVMITYKMHVWEKEKIASHRRVRIVRAVSSPLNEQHVTVLSSLFYISTSVQNPVIDQDLYNNQINARALIGQSAMGYCPGKPMGKSRVF